MNLEINKINFFAVNSKELNLEFNKYKNFSNYIEYIINEYKESGTISFINYLNQKIREDFDVKIDENELENLNDVEDDKYNTEIKEFIEQIIDKMKGKFSRKITYEEYLFIEQKIEKKLKEDKNNSPKNIIVNQIYEAFENSFKNVIDYFDNKIKNYDNYIGSIINKNDNNENKNEKKNNLKEFLNEYDNLEINEKNKEKINSFLLNYINTIKNIINKLKNENKESQFLQDIIKEIENVKKFFEERRIRIPLLGGYSVGKSSLLNSFLEEKILETSETIDSQKNEEKEINAIINDNPEFQYFNNFSDITTNIFLIIRNCEENNIGIWKAKYTELNDYIYFEKEGNNLCSSKANLKEKIKELNKINSKEISENNVYYIMQYPIKSFFKMNIKEELINKIEFIDYPGLDVGNEFFEENIFKELIASSDIFLYVNNYDLVNQKSNTKL